MNSPRFLLCGLPCSGKTSFLAAFWIYAGGAEQSALKVTAHPADTKYLNTLQEHWLQFKEVPRTPRGSDHAIPLKIERRSDNQKFELTLPDLSGELFEEIWSGRHWSKQFQSSLDQSAGVLLFINPNQVNEGITIQEVRGLQEEVQQEVPATVTPTVAPDPAPFDINGVPTQTKLIDILQLILEHGKVQKPFRVAIVVSAWDSVLLGLSGEKPFTWLTKRMPALVQFLQANSAQFEFTVFGVSAQGGDYATMDEAAKNEHPHRRCLIHGDTVTDKSDVTSPVVWLTR